MGRLQRGHYRTHALQQTEPLIIHLISEREGDVSRWMPDAIEQWSLTTFRKIVRHGRYVVFQTAEVAIPHELFANILLVSIGSDC